MNYEGFKQYVADHIKEFCHRIIVCMRSVSRNRERTMTWFGMHFPLRETAILYLSFIWNHTIRPIQMEPGWMTFYRNSRHVHEEYGAGK